MNKIDGVVDSSGFRVYWTKSLRQHDASVLEIGDPFVFLAGTKVGADLSQHSFSCPSECTSTYLGEEVTVFSELLHMHEKGIMMTNEHIRGADIVRKSSVEYYDFQQVGGFIVPQNPFTMKPSDSFRLKCFYSATDIEEFGFGSFDEMCIAYLYYYPVQSFPYGVCGYNWFYSSCSTEYASQKLNQMSDLGRIFGNDNLFPSNEPSRKPQIQNSIRPSFMPSISSTSNTSFTPSLDNLSNQPSEIAATDLPTASAIMSPVASRNCFDFYLHITFMSLLSLLCS